ncbi:MAG: hypothetical protein H6719_21975 [Sandaracinaceae bacterium]|nr:hypothetical protein [Sandaracinaceae bacterium]
MGGRARITRGWAAGLLALWLAMVLVPALGAAQTTGGSFGGGDFGTSPSSTSSGSSSSSPSSSSSSSSSDDDDGGGEAIGLALYLSILLVIDEPLMGVPILLGTLLLGGAWLVTEAREKGLVGGLLFAWLLGVSLARTHPWVGWVLASIAYAAVGALGFFIAREKLRRRPFKRARVKHEGAYLRDVSVLSIGLDPSARELVDRRLAEIESHRGSVEERLRRTASLLRSVRMAWLYGAASNFPMESPAAADARRDREIEHARAFAARAVPSGEPHAWVITLVVTSKAELPEIANADHAGHMDDALEVLEGYELLGERRYSLIVAPRHGSMSEETLKTLYPELATFEAGSMQDRTFCGACGKPYALALERCTHCGASPRA